MEEAEALLLTPAFFMIFPLAGAIAIVVTTIVQVRNNRRAGMRVGMGTYVMPALLVGILLFLSVWCAVGLVDATDLSWIQASVVLTAAGVLLPRRDRIQRLMDDFAERGALQDWLMVALRLARDVLVVALAALFARNALEVPWNEGVRELSGQSVTIEYAFIALLMATTFFLGQRTAAGPIVVTLVSLFIGIAQSFLLRFKEAPILPSDLLALDTAAEVANQYTYSLTDANIQGFMFAGLALLVLCFLRPIPLVERNRDRIVLAVLVNLALALPFALAFDWWIEVPNYRADFGFDIYYWRAARAYASQGFLPTFMTAVQDLAVEEPAGYSEERAEELTERYASATDAMPERSEAYAQAQRQFNRLKPSVIVVMNETFADLSQLDGLRCNYEGPTFFKSLDDTLTRGNVGVSVYGGGTCNSEFEMLTGNSLAFVGAGKYPYQMFDFEKVDNLARQFSEIGYDTWAMHPNLRNNWNRSKVYGEMGFDRFVSIDDFPEDAPRLHMGITDRATYEVILDELRTNPRPQFIHDVTMQNHGGYAEANIPAARMTHVDPPGFSENQKKELNVYLSCIRASDEDLEWFVGELRELSRPVVLVFFGDHHPNLSNLYNDRFWPEEDELEHSERVYQTSYVVWANYDVAGNDQVSDVDDIGLDALGARTLDLVGAPLTDFQKAQLAVHRRLSMINALGYRGTDGRWHEAGSAPYLDTTYRDMALMDYLNFGAKFSKQHDED